MNPFEAVLVEFPEFTTKVLSESNGSALREAVPMDDSSLSFQLPKKLGSSFYAWHSDFVLKGRNSDNFETQGTLRSLSPTDKNTRLFSLALEHVGILSVARLLMKPGYAQVEMYGEKWVFTIL